MAARDRSEKPTVKAKSAHATTTPTTAPTMAILENPSLICSVVLVANWRALLMEPAWRVALTSSAVLWTTGKMAVTVPRPSIRRTATSTPLAWLAAATVSPTAMSAPPPTTPAVIPVLTLPRAASCVVHGVTKKSFKPFPRAACNRSILSSSGASLMNSFRP